MWCVLWLMVFWTKGEQFIPDMHPNSIREFFTPAEQCRSLSFWLGSDAEDIGIDDLWPPHDA